MNLLELKDFINSLSSKYDDALVVNGEFGLAKDGKTFVLGNKEVLTIYVDEPNNEIQFLHQTDKDVKDLIFDLGDDGTTERT